VLHNEEIKKICLRRSIFQSYVSLRIALKTNVWLVKNTPHAKNVKPDPVKIKFSVPDFERFEKELQQFWSHVIGELDKTQQDYCALWYRQISDMKIISRCAEFIGATSRIDRLQQKLKKQNVARLADKVMNYEDLEAYAKARGMEKHLL